VFQLLSSSYHPLKPQHQCHRLPRISLGWKKAVSVATFVPVNNVAVGLQQALLKAALKVVKMRHDSAMYIMCARCSGTTMSAMQHQAGETTVELVVVRDVTRPFSQNVASPVIEAIHLLLPLHSSCAWDACSCSCYNRLSGSLYGDLH
jgi:hypothetical protein